MEIFLPEYFRSTASRPLSCTFPNKDQLLAVIDGHVLATGMLMGHYQHSEQAAENPRKGD